MCHSPFVQPPAATPAGSYAAWFSRDIVSMAFFFTLPPIVGKEVAAYTGSQKSGENVAQFGLPLILQFATTPIHLLGYDIFNNPNNTTAQRIEFMKKDYFKNVSIRTSTRSLAYDHVRSSACS